MIPLKTIFSLTGIFFFTAGCATKIIYKEIEDRNFQQNIWLNDDTLQWKQVNPIDSKLDLPLTMRQKKACEVDETVLKKDIAKVYPSIENTPWQILKHEIIYLNEDQCELILEIHHKNLRQISQPPTKN